VRIFDCSTRARKSAARFFFRPIRGAFRALREQWRTPWHDLQLACGEGMSDKCRSQREF